jgi:ATP-dependent exoDNAse (exonuclease V) beta subunit
MTQISAPTAANDRALLVRASAGTGKTYQLTARLIGLLVSGANPSSILATTFTRKAAGEILSRVLNDLARAAIDASAREALRVKLNEASVSHSQAAELLHLVFRELHQLRICTLDSLFQHLARARGSLMGLPPGWRLTDENEEELFRDLAIDQMVERSQQSSSGDPSPANDLRSLLSMLQREQSEKSVHRQMSHVVEQCYSIYRLTQPEAWHVLDVPDAPSQAEVRDAIRTLRELKFGHKTADAAFAKLADSLDCGDGLEIASHTTILKQALRPSEDPRPRVYCKKTLSPDLLRALETAAAFASHSVCRVLHDQTIATQELLERYSTCLEELRRSYQAHSFEDITIRLAQQLRQQRVRPDQWLADQLDHLLLDEFQDTSRIQWEILRPLAAGNLEHSRGTFFCVGDAKQAIYGWRGGDVQLFADLPQQISQLKQHQSNTSFRSSPVILDFVNAVFKHLPAHGRYQTNEEKDTIENRRIVETGRRFAAEFPTHMAAQTDLPGRVEIHTSLAKDEGGNIEHATLTTAATLIQRVAEHDPRASIGVLVARNRYGSRLVAQLRAAGCRVSHEGGSPLTDSMAVRIVLAAIRLCEHPADRRHWFLLKNSPLDSFLELPDADPSSPDLTPQAHAAAQRLRQKLDYQGLSSTIAQLGDALLPHCDAGDAERLEQLFQLALHYERQPGPRWSLFIRLAELRDVPRAAPERIRVMTIHQAKGLEFDAVILPELFGEMKRQTRHLIAQRARSNGLPRAVIRFAKADWQLFLPKAWQEAAGEMAAADEWETLSKLYVALTRAKQALYLVIPPASNSKKPEATSAGVIRASLASAVGEFDSSNPSSLVYESGDAQWAVPSASDPPSSVAPVEYSVDWPPVANGDTPSDSAPVDGGPPHGAPADPMRLWWEDSSEATDHDSAEAWSTDVEYCYYEDAPFS